MSTIISILNNDLSNMTSLTPQQRKTFLTQLVLYLEASIGVNKTIGVPTNIDSFLQALDLYTRYGLKFNTLNPSLLNQSRDFLSQIDALFDDDIIDIYMRQYEHIRFLIGRQLVKCRSEYNDCTQPLKFYLKSSPELKELFTELDGLRFKIDALRKISHIDGDLLETSDDILNTTNCTRITERFTLAREGNYESLKTALNLGASINDFDAWGQLIHYVSLYASASPKLLHLLFRCPEIELNKPMRYDLNDTYGPGIRPILYTLNAGHFESGILFCAQGYDINEHNPSLYYNKCDPRRITSYTPYFNQSDLGNSYMSWNGIPNLNPCSQLCISLTKEMNNPQSKINKTDLRKAYTYYKIVETGHPCELKVSGECLLLLTCILGDLHPYQTWNGTLDLNTPLECHGLTYLMVACYCGHYEIVNYLINHNANLEATTDLSYRTALNFAQNNHSIIDLLTQGPSIPLSQYQNCHPMQIHLQTLNELIKLVPYLELRNELIQDIKMVPYLQSINIQPINIETLSTETNIQKLLIYFVILDGIIKDPKLSTKINKFITLVSSNHISLTN